MKAKLNDDFIFEMICYILLARDNFESVFSELSFNLDYVNSKEAKKVLLEIRRYVNKNGDVPKLSYLDNRFLRDEDVLLFLDDVRIFQRTNKINEESTLSTLEEFIKRTRFANLYREMGEAYNKGEQDKAFQLFQVGSERITNFHFHRNRLEKVFGDFDNRMTKRLLNLHSSNVFRIPYCVEQLNYHTNGGAESGEFYLALGDSGTGKSTFLINNGVEAARRGFNVLHVQAEGTKRQIEMRYDQCWSAMTKMELESIQDMEGEEWEERLHKFEKVVKNISGEIYIESFTSFEKRPNVRDIRELLKNFNKEGIKIHLVLVDYLELLDPINNKWEDETQRQGFVARNFKDIAVEFNCVVGSVTQMQRVDKDSRNSADWVAERDNIGGAYEKVRPTDFFLTFNITPDEKKKNMMRVFLDKAREHDSKMVFTIFQDLSRSRFINKVKTRQNFFDPRKKK